jgi:hypothetical protein
MCKRIAQCVNGAPSVAVVVAVEEWPARVPLFGIVEASATYCPALPSLVNGAVRTLNSSADISPGHIQTHREGCKPAAGVLPFQHRYFITTHVRMMTWCVSSPHASRATAHRNGGCVWVSSHPIAARRLNCEHWPACMRFASTWAASNHSP